MSTKEGRVKSQLKLTRTLINEQKYAEAVESALAVLKIESGNGMANVMLGLCHHNLGQHAKSEVAYQQAISCQAGISALQGLEKLYLDPEWPHQDSSKRRWAAYVDQVCIGIDAGLVVSYANRGDWRKWTDSMACCAVVLPSVLYRHADSVQVWQGLLASPNTAWPALLPSHVYPPVEMSRQDALMTLLTLKEDLLKTQVLQETNTRRYRLGAPPLSVIKTQVETEFIGQSDLHEFYHQVLAETQLEPSVLFGIQARYATFLHRRIIVAEDGHKSQYRVALDKLLNNMDSALVTSDINVAEMVFEQKDVGSARLYEVSLARPIAKKYPTDKLGLICTAFLQWLDGGDPFQCVDALKPLVGKDQCSSVFAWLCLAEAQLAAEDFNGALATALIGKDVTTKKMSIEQWSAPLTMRRFDLILASCYVEGSLQDVKGAVQTFRQVLKEDNENLDAWNGLVRGFERQEMYAESLKCIAKVAQLDVVNKKLNFRKAWHQFLNGDISTALECMEETMKSCQDEATYLDHFRLGRVRWALEGPYRLQRDYALSCFLKAAKMNPDFAPSFEYLGHYYAAVKDVKRAMQCYQRSLNLNPKQTKIPSMLVEMYELGSMEDSALDVCRVVADTDRSALWAWKKLGDGYMKRRDYRQAVAALQSAVRCYVDDPDSWRGLAQAYQEEGRFISALKAWAKVQQLLPADYYSYHMSALVKSKLGLYEEAIELFEHALQVLRENLGKQADTTNVVNIRYDLGNTELAFCKYLQREGYFGRAADNLRSALEHVSDKMLLEPSNTKVWSLVGRILICWHHLVAELKHFPVGTWLKLQESAMLKLRELSPDHFLHELDLFPVNSVEQRTDVVKASITCFQCAIALSSDPLDSSCARDWNELSLCYNDLPDSASVSSFCCQVALKCEPENSRHWNTLAYLHKTSDPQLAKKALCKAIELDSNDAILSCNLGLLYFTSYEVGVAKLCFDQAQMLDPELSTAWFAQSFLASGSADDNHSKDILLHSMQLSAGSVMCINYAYAELLYRERIPGQSFEHAIFAMRKYVEARPQDVAGLNLLALCLEKESLYEDAAKYMAEAFKIVWSQDSGLSKSESRTITVSLARILCAAGFYSESIEYYDLLKDDRSNVVLFGKAVATSLNGAVEKAVNCMEPCLADTESESLKNHMTVVLSQIFCLMDTPAAQQMAVTRLLDLFQCHNDFPAAILQLLQIGLDVEDMDLAGAAYGETKSISRSSLSNSESRALNSLSSQYFTKLDQTEKALTFLQHSILTYPHQAAHWADLIHSLSQQENNHSTILILCSTTKVLERDSGFKSDQSVSKVCVVSIARSLLSSNISFQASVDQNRECFKRIIGEVSLSVKFRPSDRENWLCLWQVLRCEVEYELTVHQNMPKFSDDDRILALLSTLRRLIDVAFADPDYVVVVRAELDTLEAMYHQRNNPQKSDEILFSVTKSLPDALENMTDESKVHSLKLLSRIYYMTKQTGKAVESLKSAIELQPESHEVWEELGSVYSRDDLESAIYCLKHAMSLTADSSVHFRLNLLLCYVSVVHGNNDEAGNYVNEALRINSLSAEARYIQGVVMMLNGNPGKAAKLMQSGLQDVDDENMITEKLLPGQGYWLWKALYSKDPTQAAMWLEREERNRYK